MNNRSRILFFTTQDVWPFWGGSEKYWYEVILSPQFRERFACTALMPTSPVMREKGQRIQDLGESVDYYTFPIGKPKIARRVVNRVKRQITRKQADWGRDQWVNWIDRHQPALVWINLSTASHLNHLWHATSVCKEKGVPCWLIIQHCHQHLFWFNDQITNNVSAVVNNATRIVFVSEGNRRSLEHAIGRRMPNAWRTFNAIPHDFIENALALHREHPVHVAGKARFLQLARFELVAKGHHLLLEALTDPVWKDRDWCLTMQGGGPVQSHMQRLIEYYGLDKHRVFAATHADNVFQMLAHTDLLIMPSLSEGMPFAMIEAMACGRPAVGTRVAGIEELIVDNETGWLARSTEVDALVEAMERAWQARDRWPEVGQNAQANVVKDFDQEKTLPDVISTLLKDIAKSGNSTPSKDHHS